MIGRIWTLYTVEVVKALRIRQTWIGPLLVLCVVLCGPLIYPIRRDGISDYNYIARVTPMALGFPGFILLLIWSAGLLSTEMSNGSIRQILVRPLRRFEYLLSKLMLSMSYAVVLVLVASGSAWLTILILGDLNGISYGGELLFTEDQMRMAWLLGALLSLAPFFAGASWALFFSTLCRSPLTAVVLCVGMWTVLDLVKYPLHIEDYVFTTWLEMPWQVFISRCDALDAAWFPDTWYCLGSSAAVIIISTLLSMLILRLRNIY